MALEYLRTDAALGKRDRALVDEFVAFIDETGVTSEPEPLMVTRPRPTARSGTTEVTAGTP